MKSFEMQLADIPAVYESIPKPLGRPVMLASPHSGRVYPTSFVELSRLNHATLRRSEDFCVDLLFDFAPDMGLGLVCAEFPRCYLDVNRSADEIDPVLFEQAGSRSVSRRVANGLGVVPRVVGAGIEIYADQLPLEDGLQRLRQFHMPYHQSVKRLSDALAEQFRYTLYIDCHSMPDSAAGRKLSAGQTCDFVLGDLHGQSCASDISQAAADCLRAMGYSVSRNDPYAGGYTTQTYGRPEIGRNCIQVEINRKLYMDERRLKLTGGFDRLKANMQQFVEHMTQMMERLNAADPAAVAAE